MNQQRNSIFDLMKGLGIILVMLAHLVFTQGMPKQIIHSFHMPLFLILAGVLAKDLSAISSFRQFTIKNARRLLLPFVVTMLMLCAWGAVQAFAKHDVGIFLRQFCSLISATADGWHTQWGLAYAGPMWFLVALFLVREMFVGIQYVCGSICDKYRDVSILCISLTLSVISVLIHPYMPSLPFCIFQSFTALGFYAVGWFIHRHPIPWWVYGLSVLVWPCAILYGYVNVESCTVQYYPLSFIGGCGGTYVIYLLCKGLDKLSSYISSSLHLFTGSLAWCGMFSLPILCMHELEMYSDIMYSLKCRIPSIAAAMGWGEVVIAIVMTIIVINIPYLKKVYK